jgi:XTP/dITP diphosphohydrolase
VKRLIVATKNPGKVAEIQRRLSTLGFAVTSLLDGGIDVDVVEDADTFVGNAVKKANASAEKSRGPALADDSGLEVDALDGRPGVFSARYGGPGLADQGRYEHLLTELAEIPLNRRTARFRAVLAFVEPGARPVTFDGTVEGRIALTPAGSSGFGYDPVFIPAGYDKTVAELGPEIKRRISHRAVALDAFVRWLRQSGRAD